MVMVWRWLLGPDCRLLTRFVSAHFVHTQQKRKLVRKLQRQAVEVATERHASKRKSNLPHGYTQYPNVKKFYFVR